MQYLVKETSAELIFTTTLQALTTDLKATLVLVYMKLTTQHNSLRHNTATATMKLNLTLEYGSSLHMKLDNASSLTHIKSTIPITRTHVAVVSYFVVTVIRIAV